MNRCTNDSDSAAASAFWVSVLGCGGFASTHSSWNPFTARCKCVAHYCSVGVRPADPGAASGCRAGRCLHEQELLTKKLLVKCEEKSAAQVDEWKEEKIKSLKTDMVPRGGRELRNRPTGSWVVRTSEGSKSHSLHSASLIQSGFDRGSDSSDRGCSRVPCACVDGASVEILRFC